MLDLKLEGNRNNNNQKNSVILISEASNHIPGNIILFTNGKDLLPSRLTCQCHHDINKIGIIRIVTKRKSENIKLRDLRRDRL